MKYRWCGSALKKALAKPFVHIVFGARQTGKTTLLRSLLKDVALEFNLSDPATRTELLADPGRFTRECEALPQRKTPSVVFVDEAQMVPSIFDAVQALYDSDKTRWRFVLCGSSARKLRQSGANLLPGRAMLHTLSPLMLIERPSRAGLGKAYIVPLATSIENEVMFPVAELEERLTFGDLPGVVLLEEEDRAAILKSYAVAHLEEEIRREALVKDWGAFVNFLRLAAGESGGVINYAAISREIGLSIPTVKGYYQLLVDMFIGFSIPAFSGSTRKYLLSTPRFCFFDLGVRHAAAGLSPGRDLVLADPGKYFEQWVGIELWKRLHYLGKGQLSHFRTKDGAEIDYIVARGDELIPVEVKWTSRPTLADARHIESFFRDHPTAKQGFVVCRCSRPQRLNERILAIPWHSI